MLQFAVGLSMAGPVFVVGVDFLRSGRPLWAGLFLGLAAVAVYAPTWIIRQIGGPRAWIRRRFGSQADDGDERRLARLSSRFRK
jgi:hypothetical protein